MKIVKGKTRTDGTVASGSVDRGNPIKVGMMAISGTPTPVTAGQRVDWNGTLYGGGFVNLVTSLGAQMSAASGASTPAGALLVGANGSGSLLRVLTMTDNVAATGVTGSGNLATAPWNYNGTTLDIVRNNTEGTLLASAARTATTFSAIQTNYNARGVNLILDVTAHPGGAETLTIRVRAIDPVTSGLATVVNSGVMFTAETGLKTLQVYPGAIETNPLSTTFIQGIALGRTWQAEVVHSSTGSWTYSLGYQYIL